MKYGLAKKLKDAGFPQTQIGRVYGSLLPNLITGGDVTDEKREWVLAPSLSELIEACGQAFYLLARETTGTEWLAEQRKGIQFFGATPEEAVANLWLALHKKE